MADPLLRVGHLPDIVLHRLSLIDLEQPLDESLTDSKGEEIMMEALATVGSVVEVEDQAS